MKNRCLALFADGNNIGGYCYQQYRCFVENTKCEHREDVGQTATSEMASCQCLLGYENTGDNTCTKILGMLLHLIKSYDSIICHYSDKCLFLETVNFPRAFFF